MRCIGHDSRRWAVLLAVVLLSLPATAHADPGAGTQADPVEVDALPYIAAGSTLEAFESEIDFYDCALDLAETGHEVVYRFELAQSMRVTAWIEGDGDGVDLDVHLLDDLEVVDGTAMGCLDRGNAIAEAQMDAGAHYIAIDTFDGDAQAGDFVLHLHAIGDTWFEMPIGEGVLWRARRGMAFGLPQVLHVVEADFDVPGVELEVVSPQGCQTVAAIASATDPTPVAAINTSFFSSCGSLNLLKEGGEVLTIGDFNGLAHGTVGIDANGMPMVERILDGQDWPAAVDAQGGLPLIVQEGEALQGEAAWAEEGLSNASFLGPNPRSFMGASGTVVTFGSADGRRPNALGLSMDNLALHASELGLTGAINVDGGGSTTMWVGAASPSGVANYPSDNGLSESTTHAGSRAVAGMALLHADPYNWDPRFQTEPFLDAAAEETYLYDADAIDLNPEDEVGFELLEGPADMVIDAFDGHLEWTPTEASPPMVDVVIEAFDGRGGSAEQAFALTVKGGMGPAETGGSEGEEGPDSEEGAGPDTSGTLGDSESGQSQGSGQDGVGGCGCTAARPRTPLGAAFALVLVVVGLRRRR